MFRLPDGLSMNEEAPRRRENFKPRARTDSHRRSSNVSSDSDVDSDLPNQRTIRSASSRRSIHRPLAVDMDESTFMIPRTQSQTANQMKLVASSSSDDSYEVPFIPIEATRKSTVAALRISDSYRINQSHVDETVAANDSDSAETYFTPSPSRKSHANPLQLSRLSKPQIKASSASTRSDSSATNVHNSSRKHLKRKSVAHALNVSSDTTTKHTKLSASSDSSVSDNHFETKRPSVARALQVQSRSSSAIEKSNRSEKSPEFAVPSMLMQRNQTSDKSAKKKGTSLKLAALTSTPSNARVQRNQITPEQIADDEQLAVRDFFAAQSFSASSIHPSGSSSENAREIVAETMDRTSDSRAITTHDDNKPVKVILPSGETEMLYLSQRQIDELIESRNVSRKELTHTNQTSRRSLQDVQRRNVTEKLTTSSVLGEHARDITTSVIAPLDASKSSSRRHTLSAQFDKSSPARIVDRQSKTASKLLVDDVDVNRTIAQVERSDRQLTRSSIVVPDEVSEKASGGNLRASTFISEIVDDENRRSENLDRHESFTTPAKRSIIPAEENKKTATNESRQTRSSSTIRQSVRKHLSTLQVNETTDSTITIARPIASVKATKRVVNSPATNQLLVDGKRYTAKKLLGFKHTWWFSQTFITYVQNEYRKRHLDDWRTADREAVQFLAAFKACVISLKKQRVKVNVEMVERTRRVAAEHGFGDTYWQYETIMRKYFFPEMFYKMVPECHPDRAFAVQAKIHDPYARII